MHSFDELSQRFRERFEVEHFPSVPSTLYEPASYFLGLGGKRIRPVMCLMGNELFETIGDDAWYAGIAIELFHNFTLVHDDIMDKAPLRRGMQTVHARNGEATALLAGDVMMVKAYDYLNKIDPRFLKRIIKIFNKTALEVCEGQQLDMDFERRHDVQLAEYLQMISLKTSVLLAASLRMGALLGGAGEGNQDHLYAFGKNLGIAFQVQDDYLDAFGDPAKFGKQVGGDIMSNKKTFLMIHTLEVATAQQLDALESWMKDNPADKVEKVLGLFRDCGVDHWALELKNKYLETALTHLEDTAVVSSRKKPLEELAHFLIQRDY